MAYTHWNQLKLVYITTTTTTTSTSTSTSKDTDPAKIISTFFHENQFNGLVIDIEGVNLGRASGYPTDLSILPVRFSNTSPKVVISPTVFVIDILTLCSKDTPLPKSVSDIIASSKYVKVFWDCRCDIDAFSKLNCVVSPPILDVQLFSNILSKKTQVSSLAFAVRRNLPLLGRYLQAFEYKIWGNFRSHSFQERKDTFYGNFQKRPLPRDHKEYAISDVFLIAKLIESWKLTIHPDHCLRLVAFSILRSMQPYVVSYSNSLDPILVKHLSRTTSEISVRIGKHLSSFISMEYFDDISLPDAAPAPTKS